jgi:hypothetical protein
MRKTTYNRLADARDTLADIRLQIAALERQRKRELLEHDRAPPDRVVDRLELELELARRLAQRCADKIGLLETLLARETQEARFPSEIGAAQERLAALTRRRDALIRKNGGTRSAADDGEIDNLAAEIDALTRHAEQLRVMAGAA